MDWGEQPRIASGNTAEIVALDDARVLKRFRPGVSAAVARREARNAHIPDDAGLPVPTVHDVTVAEGQPAIVYERVPGPTMRARLGARPWTIRRNARLLAALQASIHATEPSSSGLRSARERLRENVDEAPGLSVDARERVRSALASLPGGRALCHGDFHPENVLLAERGPVVVDWLDAGRGHPAADAARTSLLLAHAGQSERPIVSAFRRAFRRLYLRAYCARTGVPQRLIRAWELPVAAARLAEDVPEAPRLRSLIESRLAGE